MQTLVVGDIHGCYVELLTLLDKAGLGDEDAIISVGDFVDVGPETPQVLKFFQEQKNAQALMGNHERKHVRGNRGKCGWPFPKKSAGVSSRIPIPVRWLSCRHCLSTWTCRKQSWYMDISNQTYLSKPSTLLCYAGR